INTNSFEKISPVGRDVVEVICGQTYTFIKLSDGTLMSCGCNQFGQLALGDNFNRNVFSEIKNVGKNVAAVTCGDSHTVVGFMDGTLMSCGGNSSGQLGLGDFKNRFLFQKIGSVGKNVVEVKCFADSTMIRFGDGILMSCGNNCVGQLGVGHFESINSFRKIEGIGKNVVEIVYGLLSVFIRFSNGTLMGCGYNIYGVLGLGDYYNRNSFVVICGIPKNIEKVTCGSYHTVITFTDGTLMSCGYNGNGQLGQEGIMKRSTFSVIKM
ncbi:MAG: chromosome condensation regulator, partial [Harvfovirus sp.]